MKRLQLLKNKHARLAIVLLTFFFGFNYLRVLHNESLSTEYKYAINGCDTYYRYGRKVVDHLVDSCLSETKRKAKEIVELVPKLIKKNDYSNLEALCIEGTFFK